MTALASDTTTATLRYIDTTGNGSPDGFVAVQVSQVGWPDPDGTVVQRVVETSATGIDLDGIPRHIHIRERVVSSSAGGAETELAVHDLDIEPDDAATALALVDAATGSPRTPTF
jgi:hypothetical protein